MPTQSRRRPAATNGAGRPPRLKHTEPQPAFLLREFLDSDEARPVRIIAEYLEPLRRFCDQQIQDTVVFFGSARVHSREAAEQRLSGARASGRSAAARAELERLKRAVSWSRYYEDA